MSAPSTRLETGEYESRELQHVMLALPHGLWRKVVRYAQRHNEDASSVVRQALERALREQTL